MASLVQVSNETEASTSRVTREGKKITYRLHVIQPPKQARAGGSGAKSSTDRRPIDPPPVIEMRIFEGDAKEDITFGYQSNFFLFVTLESARPIAPGRVGQQTPVLMGVFVSGMSYLDRPLPAGYFLFSDLAVRHEGCYRLAFSLYEEVKNPKDMDQIPNISQSEHNTMLDQLTPKAQVDWRLEVRSEPFTVYSAKRFPGLAESTALSRTIAEQGCRVRIRRDVRMRRRDAKATTPEYEENEDEAEYARRGNSPPPQTAEPKIKPEDKSETESRPHQPSEREQHQPSSSNSSSEPTRTTRFPPLYSRAVPASNLPSYSLSEPRPQMTYVPMPTTNYSHPKTFQSCPHPRPSTESRAPPSPPSLSRRPSIDRSTVSDYRPLPFNYQNSPTSPQDPFYSYSENGYGRPASNLAYSKRTAPFNPFPPIKMPLPIEPKYDSSVISPPTEYPSGSALSTGRRSGSFGPMETRLPEPAATEARGSKRSYGTVFEHGRYEHAPYRNGSRPPTTNHSAETMHPRIELDTGGTDNDHEYPGDDKASIQALRMQYKRADGTEISRRLPFTS